VSGLAESDEFGRLLPRDEITKPALHLRRVSFSRSACLRAPRLERDWSVRLPARGLLSARLDVEVRV
jgi:hypothetical protein